MRYVILHTLGIPGLTEAAFRRKMLIHSYSRPDCPRCADLGIDWLTVEIEVDDSPPAPNDLWEWPTWGVRERKDRP